MASIIDRATNAVTAAGNYVAETVSGSTSESKAELNKQELKSDQTTIGQKATAAGEYLSNKADQKSHEGQAELHKQDAKHS